MATTNTVSSPAAGHTLYSFTALATGDTFDIDVSAAHTILFQVTGGTFGATPAVCAVVGSLDGTNWTPLYQFQQPTTGVAVTTAVQASVANQVVWHVQPTRWIRVQVTGAGGSGITAQLLIRSL